MGRLEHIAKYPSPDELRETRYAEFQQEREAVSNSSEEVQQRRTEIAEAGGVAEFWGLFTLDGKRIAAKLLRGKFGPYWLCVDRLGNVVKHVPYCTAAAELQGLPFVLPKRGKQRIGMTAKERKAKEKSIRARIAKWEAKHGLSQRRERAPATALVSAHGMNLDNSTWVEVVRTDGGYSGEVVYLEPTEKAEWQKVLHE
jgi:hypothetical protein